MSKFDNIYTLIKESISFSHNTIFIPRKIEDREKEYVRTFFNKIENYNGGDLDLRTAPSVLKLPDNFTVDGNLYLDYSKITQLPENLTVIGLLNISFTSIKKIPESTNATVIDVSQTGISIEKPPNSYNTLKWETYSESSEGYFEPSDLELTLLYKEDKFIEACDILQNNIYNDLVSNHLEEQEFENVQDAVSREDYEQMLANMNITKYTFPLGEHNVDKLRYAYYTDRDINVFVKKGTKFYDIDLTPVIIKHLN